MWTSSIVALALGFGFIAVPICSMSECASVDGACAAESAANTSVNHRLGSTSTQGGSFIQKKKEKKSSMEETMDQESHVWLVNFHSGGFDEDLSRFCELLSNKTADAACIFKGHPSSRGLPILGARATRSQLDDALKHFPEVHFVERDQEVTPIRTPPFLFQTHGGTKEPKAETQCIGGVWKKGIGQGGSNKNYGKTSSFSECIERVKEKDAAANGVTWTTKTGDCFGMRKMTGVHPHGGYQTCEFESCSTFESEEDCPSTWCVWNASATPTEAQTCHDTPDWVNGYGKGCAAYAKNNWCSNGGAMAGSEWTLGSKYKFPEDNCCVCGKTCHDTPDWVNGYRRGCADYAKNNWCTNGGAVAGKEWTLGIKYKFPEDNCCVCGKTQGYTGTCQTTTTSTHANWGLDRIDGKNGLDGSYAGERNTQLGAGVHVYIMDAGIRCSHEEFMPEGRCIPTLAIRDGKATVCNSSWPECAEPIDGHGTMVASVVGGVSLGVAPGAIIHSVTMQERGKPKYGHYIFDSLDWVAVNAQHPAVMVMSLSAGKGESPTFRSAIDTIVKSGISVYVAAGNQADDTCKFLPQKYESVMNVMGTGQGDKFMSMSNSGPCGNIFAPGAGIRTASSKSDSATTKGSGTSLSAPFVAGAAAIILGHHPSATSREIYATIQSQATTGLVKDIPLANTPNKQLYVGNLLTGDYVLAKGTSFDWRYVMTPAGSSACAHDTVAIESKAACKNASHKLGRNAVIGGSWSTTPPGCIYDTRNKNVFWNENAGGKPHARQAPICVVTDTTAPPALRYVMTPVGSSSCADNTDAIESKAKCEDASSELGRNAVIEGSWSTTPPGCIYDQRNENVFWNKEAAGKAHASQGPICVDTGMTDIKTE